MNEKDLQDRKTTLKIIDFSTESLKMKNFTFEPCPKSNFVRLRLGFDVPEHIAPVRHWKGHCGKSSVGEYQNALFEATKDG